MYTPNGVNAAGDRYVTSSTRVPVQTRYAAPEEVFPAGSVLKVRLSDAIGSDRSHEGDRFTATVNNEGTGYNLPAGTRVEGVVTEVQPANNDRPGMLDVDFRTLQLPDGRSYPLVGAPTSLDSKAVERIVMADW